MGDPTKESKETEAAEPTDKGKATEPAEETANGQGTGPEGPDYDLVAELKEERDNLLSENTAQADSIGEYEAEVKALTEALQKANHTIVSMKGMLKKKGVKNDKFVRHE